MRVGAEALELGRDLLHVPRRQELALLDVDRAAGLGGGAQQVGLAAEEGGDLQHVDHLGHGLALPALVDVGQHRQARGLLHLGQDLDALLQPDATRAGGAGAVGLVERALVDQRHAQLVGEPLELARHRERMVAALDGAGPGDQGQRQMVARRRRCRSGSCAARSIIPASTARRPPGRRRRTGDAAPWGATSARDGTARPRTRDGPAARSSRAGAHPATCRRIAGPPARAPRR